MPFEARLSRGRVLLLILACLGLWIGLFYACNNADARFLPDLLRRSGRSDGQSG